MEAWQQSEKNQAIHMGILQTAEWPRVENACWMMVSGGAFLLIPAFHSPLHFGPYVLSPPALVHFDLSAPESQHMVAKQKGAGSFSVLLRKNVLWYYQF